MSSPDTPNYPDVLGAITGGPRLNIDVVQVALAIRPAQIPAGQTGELILLAQNASDQDIDVLIQVELPERDQARQKNVFTAAKTKLRIGLRPAEVGFLALPITVAPITRPAPGYIAGLNLDVQRVTKKTAPQRIRAAAGGGRFQAQDVPETEQNHLRALRELSFSADPGKKKKYLQTSFNVLPAGVTGLGAPSARWIALWTMSYLSDEYAIARQVAEPARASVAAFKRQNVFMPLLKATQQYYAVCGYSLLPPEAIFITKQLTLLLEAGVVEVTPNTPRPVWPRWYIRLCRLLAQDAAAAGQTEALVTKHLYNDLIYDAIMAGFKTVTGITHENFGTDEETSDYAEEIVDSLSTGQPLDFARAYLPLIMAGVVANARVSMPQEQIRDTVFMLSKALEKRQIEKDGSNDFVFDLTEKLIEQALDVT